MALTDLELPERALSLIQPMGTAIVKGWKPIENRSWRPWESIVGKMIAIHASAKWDDNYANMVGRITGWRPIATVQSAIIGVARVTGYVTLNEDTGVATRLGEHGVDSLPLEDLPGREWFVGPYGWTLADAREIDPIPCKGSRGLWQIKSAMRDVLRERLAVAA